MAETTKTPAKPAKVAKAPKPAPVEAEPTGRVLESYQIILRPLVTEKGVAKKDDERTLCFEVAPGANKTQVKQAVEKLFKVKVAEVRTANFEGKLRRQFRKTLA